MLHCVFGSTDEEVKLEVEIPVLAIPKAFFMPGLHCVHV